MYKREIAAMLANDTATHPGDRPDRPGPRPLPAPDEPGEPGVARRPTRSRRAGTAATRTTSPAPTTSCSGGLPVFDARPAAPRTAFPTLGPSTPDLPEELRNRILLYVLNGGNTVAPPCRKQAPFTFGGETTRLPARRPRRRSRARSALTRSPVLAGRRVPDPSHDGELSEQEERMSVKVGINGFGRIGRNFFRAACERGSTSSSWR